MKHGNKMINNIVLQNCKRLLESYPELRELINIRKAIWTYWSMYCGIGDYMSRADFLSSRLPHPETLAGAFRTVKRNNPQLQGSSQSVSMSHDNEQLTKERLGYSTMTREQHIAEREMNARLNHNTQKEE